jgi:hypothetical protein
MGPGEVPKGTAYIALTSLTSLQTESSIVTGILRRYRGFRRATCSGIPVTFSFLMCSYENMSSHGNSSPYFAIDNHRTYDINAT